MIRLLKLTFYLGVFTSFVYSSAQSLLSSNSGVYYSTSSYDTVFYYVDSAQITGYDLKNNFYFVNEVTWDSQYEFTSTQKDNNGEKPTLLGKGTVYKCEIIVVNDSIFKFRYKVRRSEAVGVLTYYKYSGPIPKEYLEIRKRKCIVKDEKDMDRIRG